MPPTDPYDDLARAIEQWKTRSTNDLMANRKVLKDMRVAAKAIVVRLDVLLGEKSLLDAEDDANPATST